MYDPLYHTHSLKDTKLDGEQDDVKKEDKTCYENDSQVLDDSDLDHYEEEMKQQRFPESVNLLLTAPTGKAANLLGKRADSPSYTLHQVIFSYRALDPDTEWKHRNVNTLVVDECSLVAVTTFAFLIQLLLENAKLRRIVLLGDVRQLPSIEPGNFLEDVFQSLSRLGCGIELRNNHRAESQIVIDNATRISKKIYPEFVAEKFTLLPVPEGNPAETGDDLVNDGMYKISPKRFGILYLCIRETSKWVLLKTVRTQMKCSIMLHFIWVYIVC